MNKELSRRSFLGIGGAAAVTAGAALGGCAPRSSETPASGASGSAATAGEPSFLSPPASIDESKVTQTIDVDVCVVGLGLAGVCAMREAAEAGAKVYGIEKSGDLGFRSGEFGTFGSKIHEQLGYKLPPTEVVVNQLMRTMGNRPNARLLNYWIKNSGQDLDWYIDPVEYELLPNDYTNPTDPEAPYILPEAFPPNANYDYANENNVNYPGLFHLLPDHGWAMRGSFEAAKALGAEAIFDTKAEQLIKDGDRVVGVYASNSEGYIRVNATKGVVLSCGDMSSDTEMLSYYAPHALKYMPFFTTMDSEGNLCNTGDGHKMALWAGAVMEDGPLAPMAHSVGTNSIGLDPFLMVNKDGERFANEDVGAQEIQNAIKRQKEGVCYQVFDSKWPEQLAAMPQGFCTVTHYVPDEEYDTYAHAIEHFGGGYASDRFFQKEIDEGLIIKAESLEELAEIIGAPLENLTATIERYNSLARAGRDEDFAKVATRLFPVENPPYYTIPFGDSGILVIIGGIDCDTDLRALDANKQPVPGLFVAGNTQGGRFLVDYPVTVSGASHSMAMSFGRLAGRNAAASK